MSATYEYPRSTPNLTPMSQENYLAPSIGDTNPVMDGDDTQDWLAHLLRGVSLSDVPTEDATDFALALNWIEEMEFEMTRLSMEGLDLNSEPHGQYPSSDDIAKILTVTLALVGAFPPFLKVRFGEAQQLSPDAVQWANEQFFAGTTARFVPVSEKPGYYVVEPGENPPVSPTSEYEPAVDSSAPDASFGVSPSPS